jgi:glycosyltransferase involved in cell wall biosynthesis
MAPHLSIIVPFFNEEDSIGALCDAVTNAMRDDPHTYELLLIDDGSIDHTFAIASEYAARDNKIKVIRFRRNFGQTPAMAAGIDYATGSVLVTMDGDLQNDPRDIPEFLKKIDAGYDIVVGWRYRRQDKLISRKIPSKIANWLIGKVTGIPIKDNGCSLKAYRASVIKQIPLYSEMHRFIPAMASIAGVRVAEIKVRHHARRFGESKYGLSRIYKVLIDLLTVKTLISFGAHPLYWFSILAAPFLAVGIAMAGLGIHRMAETSGGFSVAIVGTGLLLGALAIGLAGLGILGEMIYQSGDLSLEKYYRFTASGEGMHDNRFAQPVSKNKNLEGRISHDE